MRVWLLSSVVSSSFGSWLVTPLVNCALLTEPVAAGFSAGAEAAGAAGAAGAAAAGAAAGFAVEAAAALLASARAVPVPNNRHKPSAVRMVLLLLYMEISLGTLVYMNGRNRNPGKYIGIGYFPRRAEELLHNAEGFAAL